MSLHLQWLTLPPVAIGVSYVGYIILVAVQEFFSERKLRLIVDARDGVKVTYSKDGIHIQRDSSPSRTITPATETGTDENACHASDSFDSVCDQTHEATCARRILHPDRRCKSAANILPIHRTRRRMHRGRSFGDGLSGGYCQGKRFCFHDPERPQRLGRQVERG
jgi:hypothetical protein